MKCGKKQRLLCQTVQHVTDVRRCRICISKFHIGIPGATDKLEQFFKSQLGSWLNGTCSNRYRFAANPNLRPLLQAIEFWLTLRKATWGQISKNDYEKPAVKDVFLGPTVKLYKAKLRAENFADVKRNKRYLYCCLVQHTSVIYYSMELKYYTSKNVAFDNGRQKQHFSWLKLKYYFDNKSGSLAWALNQYYFCGPRLKQ